MYIYHVFFIHSSVDGHLGCSHVLTVVNSASMNIGVCVHISHFEKKEVKISWLISNIGKVTIRDWNLSLWDFSHLLNA